jgi:hypothetical protein
MVLFLSKTPVVTKAFQSSSVAVSRNLPTSVTELLTRGIQNINANSAYEYYVYYQSIFTIFYIQAAASPTLLFLVTMYALTEDLLFLVTMWALKEDLLFL